MKETQRNQVRSHLIKFGWITPLQALRLYGCYRLSSVILRLRNEGMEITTDMTEQFEKSKGTLRFATYRYDPSIDPLQDPTTSIHRVQTEFLNNL